MRTVLSHIIGLATTALALCLPANSAEGQTTAVNPWWNAYHQQAQLISLPDGRKINLLCQGSGSPTIILESGGGSGAWDWRKVQLPLAAKTRTCAYDRAGYGSSDPGPMPRDVTALVSDLEVLLDAAKIEPPYILVGHSLGGPNIRLFSARHLKLVKGLVLVDPGVEHQTRRYAAVIPNFSESDDWITACINYLERSSAKPDPGLQQRCSPDAPAEMPAASRPFHDAYVKTSQHWRTLLAEFRGFHGPTSAAMDAAPRDLGDVPLIVLTADVSWGAPYTEEDERQGRLLRARLHEELAALSRRGERRLVPSSAHAIQDSHPQVVIDAVMELVASARSSESGRQ